MSRDRVYTVRQGLYVIKDPEGRGDACKVVNVGLKGRWRLVDLEGCTGPDVSCLIHHTDELLLAADDWLANRKAV